MGTRDQPTYLPPEYCIVVPGQPARSKLTPGQTQQMIRFAVRKPQENMASIIGQGISTSGLSPQTNPLLASLVPPIISVATPNSDPKQPQFGIQASQTLITVSGRVLNEPKIVYGNNKAASVRSGGWNIVDVRFNSTGSLKKWSYLLLSVQGYRDAFDMERLGMVINGLGKTLMARGIRIDQPLRGNYLAVHDEYDIKLENLLRAASTQLDLLFIVLPDSNMPIYNRIKHYGDVKYGLQTICSVGHKLAKERGQDQYFNNLALKFNLKLGGNNHLVDRSRLGIVTEDKTMVVGIDVTHPSPGSASHAPSIAGMVASVDQSLGQWPGILSVQSQARQEMVSDLSGMLKSRLTLWRTMGKHQSLPENILVYRDGVSEGQYQLLLDEELPLLRKACQDVYPPDAQKRGLPRFTVVVAGKRHHTRFYPTSEANADRSSNCKAGTVVDRGVTEARNWDFFLQAHSAIQGTARPAHYFVVVDEIFRARKAKPPFKNTADELEDLTQAMSWVFGRATRAVSLCTPAYYADIMCERARCYLSGLFDTPDNTTVAQSVVGSEDPASGPTIAPNAVQIHERVRNTMFYI